LSEHDWQATVLAELGVPRTGLVTPDSSGASAPTAGHPAPSPEELREPPPAPPVPQAARVEPPSRPEEELSSSPAPTQWDEPKAESAQWAPAHSRTERPPAASAPWSEPPAAQVRSTPASPQSAAWSPPAWETPPPEERTPRQEEPQARGWPQEQPPEEAAPNQAAAWELASQTHWGLVAQAPWGTEPPPEEEPASRQQPWERSDAEAWQAGQRDVAAPHPPSGSRRPAPQDLVRRSTHGDPLVRRVGRGVRRAVGAAAANEIRRTADVESVLSRPVSSCRQIAVTSIRGGAGKTTVAGLTATVISQYRQDRVLAVDADSGLGSLPLRLGVRPARSLHDLTAANPRTFEEVTPFLSRTADGLWVLSGTAGGHITHELDLDTFKSAAGRMTRYFSALVIDCGAGLLPELQRGILGDAHAQVMVTPGTVDGALSAQGALEWQARNGYQHLLTRTVVAFVTHTPHVDSDLTRAAQLLSGGGMPVVHMPYDRHLATGTAVESARIGQETRAAAIRVALEAFARATSV
jgi:MinD-like ATPase involved in chromosome partitioning or flagellar assembly